MRELASVHPADVARRWRHIFEDLKETNKQQDQLIRGQPGVSVENIDSNMGGTERGREGGREGRGREGGETERNKEREGKRLPSFPSPGPAKAWCLLKTAVWSVQESKAPTRAPPGPLCPKGLQALPCLVSHQIF